MNEVFLAKVVISEEMLNIRLDKLLTVRFPNHSRAYFQHLIEKDFVLANGRKIKKGAKLSVGDKVEVYFEPLPEIDLKPEKIPLQILYEDADIIVINKPAGMVIHPAPGNYTHTFVHALLGHCETLPFDLNSSTRPGIVHRLDKETSGALIAAKTIVAHRRLVQMFANREVIKTYLAICVGPTKDEVIAAPIKRHPTKRKEMRVDSAGKPAISICRVLDRNSVFSLVEIQPVTGKTHQIRVHLKHRGVLILGDSVYGNVSLNKKYRIERQMLHAYRLKFTHPVHGEQMDLIAPWPEDFAALLSLEGPLSIS